jgi:hypothetical protein
MKFKMMSVFPELIRRMFVGGMDTGPPDRAPDPGTAAEVMRGETGVDKQCARARQAAWAAAVPGPVAYAVLFISEKLL